MKKVAILLTALLGAACSQNEEAVPFEKIVSQEIVSQKLGSKEVYGVKLELTGQETSQWMFDLKLKVGDNTYSDTLWTELYPGDTTLSEVFFTDAEVQPNVKTELTIEASPIER